MLLSNRINYKEMRDQMITADIDKYQLSVLSKQIKLSTFGFHQCNSYSLSQIIIKECNLKTGNHSCKYAFIVSQPIDFICSKEFFLIFANCNDPHQNNRSTSELWCEFHTNKIIDIFIELIYYYEHKHLYQSSSRSNFDCPVPLRQEPQIQPSSFSGANS